jgi:hypothetical protein
LTVRVQQRPAARDYEQAGDSTVTVDLTVCVDFFFVRSPSQALTGLTSVLQMGGLPVVTVDQPSSLRAQIKTLVLHVIREDSGPVLRLSNAGNG